MKPQLPAICKAQNDMLMLDARGAGRNQMETAGHSQM
jgi:hypothetical protein